MNGQHEPVISMPCPEPDCERSAEVLDRFTLWSTDGEILHLKVRCGYGHWFTLPVGPVSVRRVRVSVVIADGATPVGVSAHVAIGRPRAPTAVLVACPAQLLNRHTQMVTPHRFRGG